MSQPIRTIEGREVDLIDILTVDDTLLIDPRYSTPHHFLKRVIYPEMRCFLRRAAAEALRGAQQGARSKGHSLKVFECYRPLSIQWEMWAVLPDERYIADPRKGSRHNRGAAVDVTLVDASGHEVEMPSPYEEFSERAHRDYAGGSETARANRDLLERIMVEAGFVPFPTEWWHFDYREWAHYPVEDIPIEALDGSRTATP